MWETLKQKIKSAWESVKNFFKNSETILISRLEAVTGLLIGAIGLIDWSPLFSLFGTSTDFNWKQLTAIGAVVFVKGLVSEWARRRNTVDVVVDGKERMIPVIETGATIEAAKPVPTAVVVVDKPDVV